MLTLRFYCALCCACLVASTARVAAQGYPQQQGYDQQGYDQQQQYPQQQYPQQQYPQQQQQSPGMEMQQQQLPPGYFPTPDAQGSYGYQQQYAPNVAGYPPQGPAMSQPATEPLVSSVAGAIQLSAGVSLLQLNSLSVSQTGVTVTPMGVPDPMATPETIAASGYPLSPYGKFDSNPFFVEGGFGLSDNLLLGALLQLASSSEPLDANGVKLDQSDFSFTFAPKLDYQLSPTSRWNPFVGAVVGITLHNKKSVIFEDKRTLFSVGARGGFRYFILDQLSIDPVASLGFNFGSGTQNIDPTQSTNATKYEYSLSGFRVAVSIGLSVWLK